MLIASPSCSTAASLVRREVLAVAILSLAICTRTLAAQSAACNRAQAIVNEVKVLYEAPEPDHRAVLGKLKTAQQLCPTLGEAWKYAHCSALALGDQQSASMARDRAIFNGVSDLSCGAAKVAEPDTPLPAVVRQKFALIVGIGTFQDGSIPKLQFAAKDADDFRKLLLDKSFGNFVPENVVTLMDEKATRAAILDAMNQIALRAQEDDLVVLFVSSHGSPLQQDRGLGGVGYIVTYDTVMSKIWLDALDYQNFAAQTSFIKARRKVVFLDTCFSGQAAKRGQKALSIEGLGVDDKTARLFLSGFGTFVIMSSRADERSWESDTIHNGYFTHYLIEALQRRPAEPPTVKEVFDYISAKLPDAVARDKQAPQHPQMQPSTGSADVRIGVMTRPSILTP
jgi:Caspase domain